MIKDDHITIILAIFGQNPASSLGEDIIVDGHLMITKDHFEHMALVSLKKIQNLNHVLEQELFYPNLYLIQCFGTLR